MTPSSSALIALAKALDVSLEFLAAPLQVRLGALEFRKKSGTSARERAHVLLAWRKKRGAQRCAGGLLLSKLRFVTGFRGSQKSASPECFDASR